MSAAQYAAAAVWLGAAASALSAGAPDFRMHIISSTNMGCRCVAAADLDGDGDQDFLSARADDNTMAWYENDGGSPPSFIEHILDPLRPRANFIRGADMDGDGDMDILSASSQDDMIAWYQNQGGSPTAFVRRVITVDPNGGGVDPPGFADGARQTMAADLDGDGDLDVASVSVMNDRVAWYENIGGSPPTFTPRVIADTVDGARAVEVADLDGDGDIDVIAGPWYGDRIAWFENQGGSPLVWVEHAAWIFTNPNDPLWGTGQIWRVHAADVDADGDVDLFSARHDFGVEWYESDGAALPTFTRRLLNPGLVVGKDVDSADLDQDGDLDVMSASTVDDVVAWYETLSEVPWTFTTHILTQDPDGYGPSHPLEGDADGARSVYPADMDGDGDLDVLWGSKHNHTIAWEENLLIDAQPPTCTGDVDGDGAVNVNDLLALLGAWGTSPGGPHDLDGSGTVNVADLLVLLGHWGPCPVLESCGSAAAGSCYTANGTSGCNDSACCQTVCGANPGCCKVAWDAACADAAFQLCGSCGEAAAGDCCTAHGSPGCDQDTCCQAVCQLDGYCCNVEWDAMCAIQAAEACACP